MADEQATVPTQSDGLKGQLSREIQNYLEQTVNIGENYDFSQSRLVRRISLFENHIYPTGKFDKQGRYKYWYDIVVPRVTSEVKNIDFDTKDINVYSERKIDELPVIITNLKIKEYLEQNGQAEEINEAVEEGAAWGNIVWKKVRGGYERVDLKNFYVINQTAECLDDTPAIERHQLSQPELRKVSGKWNQDAVRATLSGLGQELYTATAETTAKFTTVPYYDIYERNGEVCLYDLKLEMKETPTEEDRNVYVLAKIIAAGKRATGMAVNIEQILYAQQISSMPYKEYHRGRYQGRWWREGIIEVLFDCQVRANEIGNQLARGLEYASKILFYSNDVRIVQNILTDLKNGDIIKSSDIKQIPVQLQGFTELADEWNRLMQIADSVSNANAIIAGERLPFGTSFRLADLLNANANKTFSFIRQKLAIPFGQIFEKWIVPQLLAELKTKDVLRLTGDSDMLGRLYQLVVDDWYLQNLPFIGPHSQDVADTLKADRMEELKKRPQLLMQGMKKMWEDFKPHVTVVITGENSSLPADLETLQTFIALEQDPVRRSAMIELAMKKKGLDVASLPKGGQPGVAAAPGGGPNGGQPQDAPAETPPNSPGKLPQSPTSGARITPGRRPVGAKVGSR